MKVSENIKELAFHYDIEGYLESVEKGERFRIAAEGPQEFVIEDRLITIPGNLTGVVPQCFPVGCTEAMLPQEYFLRKQVREMDREYLEDRLFRILLSNFQQNLK